MISSVLFIIIGLVCLVKGGDWLVDGSVSIAQHIGLSPMVIGLTIVAFGTSAPELLVSMQSAMCGNSGIALGNVVGSNIANIALILGLTAAIAPIPARIETFKRDMPFMLLCTLALTLITFFIGTINRVEGIIGIILLVLFVVYQIRTSKQEQSPADDTQSKKTKSLWFSILLIVISLVLLKFGAQWLVNGATAIAKSFGVSDRIIGLTIVALGTSLPELFASVIAARKGAVDLAVGNVIGSNIFNIMCVLGLSGAISPINDIDSGFMTDSLWMLGLSIMLWIMLRTKYELSRWEGWLFLVIYLLFLCTSILPETI